MDWPRDRSDEEESAPAAARAGQDASAAESKATGGARGAGQGREKN